MHFIILTCVPDARQRLGKHIRTGASHRTPIARKRISKHASNGIRNYDPNVRKGEDGSCLKSRPPGHCDGLIFTLMRIIVSCVYRPN
jgi:hypothetical protein